TPQANQANQTAIDATNMMNAQAAQANQTATEAVASMEAQVAAANATLETHLSTITPVAGELMQGMSSQLERMADPLTLVATLIGPLQILTGMNVVLTMLTTLNLVSGPMSRIHQTAKEIKVELGQLTDAVKGVRDEMHSGSVLQKVRNITGGGKSFQLDDTTSTSTTITCFCFYSSDQSCVLQLKGKEYCAFSSVRELFQFIERFNRFGKISRAVGNECDKTIKSNIKVLFLDPQPEQSFTIPYYHFEGDSIEFINLSPVKETVAFHHIFVGKGSKMSLVGVKVGNLVSPGETELLNCIVQHNPANVHCLPNLESPTWISIPAEQQFYSVGDVHHDQCTFLGGQAGSGKKLFKQKEFMTFKEKKRTLTNCSGQAVSVCLEGLESVNVSPGQGFSFSLKRVKDCAITVQNGEVGLRASLSYDHMKKAVNAKGKGYPNVLFLYTDNSEYEVIAEASAKQFEKDHMQKATSGVEEYSERIKRTHQAVKCHVESETAKEEPPAATSPRGVDLSEDMTSTKFGHHRDADRELLHRAEAVSRGADPHDKVIFATICHGPGSHTNASSRTNANPSIHPLSDATTSEVAPQLRRLLECDAEVVLQQFLVLGVHLQLVHASPTGISDKGLETRSPRSLELERFVDAVSVWPAPVPAPWASR
ncbi:hypothetical protein THAOC_03720, partial [Thalassiosira oceanica]